MKCAPHHADAIGVCAYCGRALCPDCVKDSAAPRLVCSDRCAASLLDNDKAVQSLLRQGLQNTRASAFYCYLCGGLSFGGAIAAYFVLPLPFLIYFTAACGVVFVVSGIWYGRAVRKNRPDPTD